jgi:hypothetical protein
MGPNNYPSPNFHTHIWTFVDADETMPAVTPSTSLYLFLLHNRIDGKLWGRPRDGYHESLDKGRNITNVSTSASALCSN